MSTLIARVLSMLPSLRRLLSTAASLSLGAVVLAGFASAEGCGGGDSGGGSTTPSPDAGDLDGAPRPDVQRIVTEQSVGTDCGGVPTAGRCKDGVTIESCFVPEALAEGDPLLVVTVTCDPGEHCVADDFGARCEPDAECIDGQSECLDPSTVRTCVSGSWQTSPCGSCQEGGELGAGCIANAPGVGGVFVRGQLTYEFRKVKADLSALETSPTVEGAVGLLVHVYDGELIGVGETLIGGNGHQPGEFEIELSAPPSKTASIHFYPIDRDPKGKPRVGVAVASQPKQWIQQSDSYYSWRADVCTSPEACATSSIDLGEIRITEQMDAGAIRVFQWLNFGTDQLRLIFPNKKQLSVAAFWSPKNVFNCGACFLGQQSGGAKIFPGGPHVDHYDTSISLSGTPPFHALPSVITHELGHFVMASYSKQTFEGGSHAIGSLATPGLAWSEGWATFYGQALMSGSLFDPDPIHVSMSKNGGNTPFWANLETRTWASSTGTVTPLPAPNPTGAVDQNVNEMMMGSIVWSLWAKGRAANPQGLGDQPILDAFQSTRMTKLDRGYPTPDLIDFLDALGCSNALYVPDITEVVAAAGYPWRPEDALCAP